MIFIINLKTILIFFIPQIKKLKTKPDISIMMIYLMKLYSKLQIFTQQQMFLVMLHLLRLNRLELVIYITIMIQEE